MSIFVIGGTGFIGRRVFRCWRRAARKSSAWTSTPAPPPSSDLGEQVRVVRGDVTQFDDVMAATVAAKPRGWSTCVFPRQRARPARRDQAEHRRHGQLLRGGAALRRNRVVFASSLAVSGEQKHLRRPHVTEDDFRHGHVQYAMHKIFNEWQAQDYREKYGMEITAIRPANVTGPDKIVGSVDHVKCITLPARGEPISFPYKDAMRCPIHVDDIAEVFARVLLADKPRHAVYNSGGMPISLGDLADLVREFLPDAQITLRARDRRQGELRQLPDRQHAAWSRSSACSICPTASACCRSSTTPAARPACRPSRADQFAMPEAVHSIGISAGANKYSPSLSGGGWGRVKSTVAVAMTIDARRLYLIAASILLLSARMRRAVGFCRRGLVTCATGQRPDGR